MKAVYSGRFIRNGIVSLLCGFIFALALPRTYAQDQLPDLVRRIKPSSVAIETFDVRGQKLSRGRGSFVDKDRAVTNRRVSDGAYRGAVPLNSATTFNVKNDQA